MIDRSSSLQTNPTKAGDIPLKRRGAAPRTEDRAGGRRSRLLSLLLAAGALILGAGIGGQMVRWHYKSSQVVASVNGTLITEQQFYRRLEEEAGPSVLRQMVAEELKSQFARQKGVAPTEAEVSARYSELSRQPDFDSNLELNGQTPETFKRRLRVSLTEAAVVQKDVRVTESDIRRFYQQNIDKKNPKARYYTPETVRLAIIVTADEATGKRAIHDLNQGIPFAMVVKNYSIDPSKAEDGVLPETVRGRTQSSRIPGLEETIFGMKIGQQIGPRKFLGRWWIIRCLDKQPERIEDYKKVKDECRTGVMLIRGMSSNAGKIQEDFTNFQKNANIQAFWSRYQSAIRVK